MKLLALFLAFLSTPQLFGFIDTVIVESKISQVKAYFSGAEITRYARLNLKPGKKILSFSGLSGGTDPNSIVCSRIENLHVIATKHQSDYSSQTDSISRRIAQLNALLQERKYSLLSVQTKIEENDLSFFFSDPDRDFIQSTSDHILSVRNQIQYELKNIVREISDLKEMVITTKNRVLVHVHCISKIEDTLKLRYFTSDVTWTPVYDVLIGDGDTGITLIKNARIRQTTGEDWNGANVEFCTANSPQNYRLPQYSLFSTDSQIDNTANLNSKSSASFYGKILDVNSGNPISNAQIELRVNHRRITETYSDRRGDYWFHVTPIESFDLVVHHHAYKTSNIPGIRVTKNSSTRFDIPLKLKAANVSVSDVVQFTAPAAIALVQTTAGTAGAIHASSVIVGSAIHLISKLIQQKPQKLGSEVNNTTSQNGLAVNQRSRINDAPKRLECHFKSQLSIPTDNSEYMVRMETKQIPADVVYYAAPKLRREAYRTLEVFNWEGDISTPASLRVYENQMLLYSTKVLQKNVGKSLRIFTSPSDDVSVTRQKKKYQSKSRNNSTTESFTWNILVENQLGQTAEVVIEDQYPVSNKESVSTELLDNDATSIDHQRGIMTWRMQLDPGERRTLQHGYTVKFPSGLKLYTN